MSEVTQRIAIQVGQYVNGETVAVRTQDVDAVVHGHWAAHKTVDGSPWSMGGWSVTHVSSGMRAHSGMTKAEAIRAAKALASELNIEDWHESRGPDAVAIMAAIGVWP